MPGREGDAPGCDAGGVGIGVTGGLESGGRADAGVAAGLDTCCCVAPCTLIGPLAACENGVCVGMADLALWSACGGMPRPCVPCAKGLGVIGDCGIDDAVGRVGIEGLVGRLGGVLVLMGCMVFPLFAGGVPNPLLGGATGRCIPGVIGGNPFPGCGGLAGTVCPPPGRVGVGAGCPVICGNGCIGTAGRCVAADTIPISSRFKPHLLQKCASLGSSALHLGQRNIRTILL